MYSDRAGGRDDCQQRSSARPHRRDADRSDVAGAGSPITVNDTTKNQGSGPAQPSVTGFYLSANTALDAADVSLGTRAVPLLAGGASASASTVLTVPSGTAVGKYYVLAKADVALTVTESTETNNVKTGSIVAVGPDLVVAAITVPTAAAAGSSITVADTTKNQGGGSASAAATNFYLSANVLLDGTDVPSRQPSDRSARSRRQRGRIDDAVDTRRYSHRPLLHHREGGWYGHRPRNAGAE